MAPARRIRDKALFTWCDMAGKKARTVQTLFPLVRKSAAMKLLLAGVLSRAQAGWVVALKIPDLERLELKSLFVQLARQRGSDGSIIIDDRYPDAAMLRKVRGKSLLFMRGDDIPSGIQRELAEWREDFPFMLVACRLDPFPAHNDNSPKLSSELREVCAAPALTWPGWSERKNDHTDLIRAMHERLTLPDGSAPPPLGAAALDLLRSKEFKGTLEVERWIKLALQDYARRGSQGDLLASHFVTLRTLHLLSSHRDAPRLRILQGGLKPRIA
jgi:hypothetical protein